MKHSLCLIRRVVQFRVLSLDNNIRKTSDDLTEFVYLRRIIRPEKEATATTQSHITQ